jgi:hypothetical protein
VSAPGPGAHVDGESQAAAQLDRGLKRAGVKSHETMTDRIGEDPIRRSRKRQSAVKINMTPIESSFNILPVAWKGRTLA